MGPTSSEDKRQMKEERVRAIFVQTTKKMILTEGADAVSVRKIADLAAYSYATLYNHFENLNELLWHTRNALMEDVGAYIHAHYPADAKGSAGVKELFKTYIEYYLLYPNAFKFFFFHDLEEPDDAFVSKARDLDFDKAFQALYTEFAVSGTYGVKEIEIIGKTILFAIHGMLMVYISGKDEISREQLYANLDDMVRYLFAKG